ncbi:ATP-binding protein [Microbacterium sp. NPDC089180]|uniref:ATP-binding protein n=1 Tax=Microbacterium galbum TaxID=3075994 RepID=A0ABU3T854_9MICO|nr:ATP-binding protein [Microbacterium sp. KSW4-17]MDU0367554.1 ATP-binding protein [Microbacterium sp. KSW4-17]
MTEPAARRSLDAAVVPASLDAIFDLLAGWWDEVGEVTPMTRFGFETAVIEIAGNIVEHSRGESDERRFTLDLFADAQRLVATFRDDGDPPLLDLASVRMADADEESGRGLALANAGVDDVDFRRDGDRNVWTLETRRE